MIDTSALPFAKPSPIKRAHRDAALDRRESAIVRKRSGGRCEVKWYGATGWVVYRCVRPAAHVMHLIGGNGTRGRGISALAIHKLHGCAEHHREIDGDIGGRKLVRLGGPVPLWTDCYRRVK